MNWQIHPFLGGEIGRGFEEERKRGGANKFSSFLYVIENVGDPKGARQPFLGKA
jgi:hypothetical protein